MNPLNPWVAVFEMLILLGLAFLLGRVIAWLQYKKQIQSQRQTILRIEGDLNRTNRVNPN